jgi:hypothetical protein
MFPALAVSRSGGPASKIYQKPAGGREGVMTNITFDDEMGQLQRALDWLEPSKRRFRTRLNAPS